MNKLFNHLKKLNKIYAKATTDLTSVEDVRDREERIVDEAFDAGRKFEREDIKRILSEKDELV